jgi:hypothetical protein
MGNLVRYYLVYDYDLIRGHVLSGPPLGYSAASVTEVKCTRLGYGTRLSRLHTLDPPLALVFLRSSHSTKPDPEQENNQETPDKSHVPQTDLPTTGLHNSNQM